MTIKDGRLVLDRTSGIEKDAPTRLVWSDIRSGSITWNYERQTDCTVWRSIWRILYIRKDVSGAPALN